MCFALAIWSAYERMPRWRRDVEAREATVLAGAQAGGEPMKVVWLLDDV
jgi:hypothetical protein